MGKLIGKQQRQSAWKVVIFQAIIVFALAIGLWLGLGTKAAWSTLVGGMCWVLPCALFTWRVFNDLRPSNATRIIRRFFAAELLKLTTAGVLAVLALRYLAIDFTTFLVGFVVALISFWLAPLIDNYRR